MKQLLQDIGREIRRIAVAAEAIAAAGGNDMVNVYNGGCGGETLLTSEIKHVFISLPLPDDTTSTESEIIAGVAGKYIAVLGGRIGCAAKAIVSVKLGQIPDLIDQAYTPENSYILPPTTVNMPHYKTDNGIGLVLKGEPLEAIGEGEGTRRITGFLKYIEVEIV